MSSARRRRRELLYLFREQRAISLPEDLGQGEVPHLEVGETLEAVPLELGLSVGSDHGIADREAAGAHGGDLACHVHLLGLVLARQNADASCVDTLVGLDWP